MGDSRSSTPFLLTYDQSASASSRGVLTPPAATAPPGASTDAPPSFKPDDMPPCPAKSTDDSSSVGARKRLLEERVFGPSGVTVSSTFPVNESGECAFWAFQCTFASSSDPFAFPPQTSSNWSPRLRRPLPPPLDRVQFFTHLLVACMYLPFLLSRSPLQVRCFPHKRTNQRSHSVLQHRLSPPTSALQQTVQRFSTMFQSQNLHHMCPPPLPCNLLH